jgi:hypothetical protein
LDFLKFYKGVKALWLYLPAVTDLKPIHHLAESLEALNFVKSSNKKASLDFLSELPGLKILSLNGQQKRLESITLLPNLEKLSLTGYPIDKLTFLNNIQTLKRLYIGFGTSKNIDTINRLENLEKLDILWVKTLENIDAISGLKSLIRLRIEDEKNIKALPDMSQLRQLKTIRLANVSSLEDISSLTNTFVEELIVTGPNKNVDFLMPLADSDCVNNVAVNFYLKKQQSKAIQILGNKFCHVKDMTFEMKHLKQLPYRRFDYETGKELT